MPPCMSGKMMRRLSLKEQKRRKVLIVFPGIWALLILIFKDVSFLRCRSQRAGRPLGRRGGRRKLASSLQFLPQTPPRERRSSDRRVGGVSPLAPAGFRARCLCFMTHLITQSACLKERTFKGRWTCASSSPVLSFLYTHGLWSSFSNWQITYFRLM